ncbi:Uma2 family endonuclease [Sphingomonas endophytica]|uniref:Uma2 family endonuclease n=1 Tax=Sphingomonas endophytica TaxID=869719 RepID=A0ABR6N0Q3_9SPHN|nr:Uma2 family endonuclease [Sphingomonas endophytica]MBB5724368.1 Uma2 family endonuclease [Sphingomonas endophytica]
MTVHQPLPPGKYRLTVDDYLRLHDAAAFGDARTELLEGDVFLMSPMHRRHGRAVTGLLIAIDAALRSAKLSAKVLGGVSVAMPPHNVPEPDLLITSDPDGDGLVPLASVLLIAEVSDSTLASDLSFKHALYAAAGVPEYWVVDVRNAVIHQMWRPVDEEYAERRVVGFGEPLTAATLSNLTVRTTGL